jgi:hypothetical protein
LSSDTKKKLRKEVIAERLARLLSAARENLQRPAVAFAAEYGHGFSFTLKNGVKARLYCLKNPEVSNVANACLKQGVGADSIGIKENDQPRFYVVKLSVPGDPIYLVPFRWDNYSKLVSNLKKFWPDELCGSIFVYKDDAYAAWHRWGALLAESIKLNASPLACVLLGQDSVGNYG